MAERKLKRAWSVQNILDKKYTLLEWGTAWEEAFANPENKGTWFIWGQSGAGKNSFILELIKELSQFGKIIMNDLEEGDAHTVQEAFERYSVIKAKRQLYWTCESMADFDFRLQQHKAPKIAIVNSWQYTGYSFKDYLKFKQKHKDKLLIFISQADGKKPEGRPAKSVMYDASLKIYVEGYKAFSKGRYIGKNGGVYTIWQEGAARYHGTDIEE